MDNPIRVTITFDRRPTTGGSGGDAAPNKNIWAHPEPQAIFGMNSNWVYGCNTSVAFPLNFQLALGSNLQICVNPAAFQTLCMDSGMDTAPSEFHRLLGAGGGGNMQFTMGTSANFVMGQIYDINIGPRRITIDLHNKTANLTLTKVLGVIFMAVVIVAILVYALIPDDDWRCGFLITFELFCQAMLIALMDVGGLYEKMDVNQKIIFNQAFQANVAPPSVQQPNPPPEGEASFNATSPQQNMFSAFSLPATTALTDHAYQALGLLEGFAIVVVMLLPVILEIVSEVKLHSPGPSQTVVDSSGNTIGTVQDNAPTGYGTF